MEKFEEATGYWLDVTMQMAKYGDGLAGFKAWRREEDGGSVALDCFLDGLAGIGLALVSNLKSENMGWDECLLLS